MNNIGDRLKLLRTAAGLTQDEVAEKLSMTRQAISSYETGRTQPDLDTIIKMAEIYDTELENIVYGKEPIIQRYEKTKHWAFVLILAVTVLITAGAALQWASGRFFPVIPGPIVNGESLQNAKNHFAVSGIGEKIDALAIILSLFGELALSLCAAKNAPHIPGREKGLYAAALAVFPMLICFLFGSSRYSLSLTNYMILPIRHAVQVCLMLLINMILCRHKKPETAYKK